MLFIRPWMPLTGEDSGLPSRQHLTTCVSLLDAIATFVVNYVRNTQRLNNAKKEGKKTQGAEVAGFEPFTYCVGARAKLG